MESRGVFTFFTIGFLLVALLCTALILAALRHDSSELYADIESPSAEIKANGFKVIAPKECTAGEEISITITAVDRSESAVPDYIGTVDVESTLPDIPSKISFSAGDFGRKQLKITPLSTGEFTIKVYDRTKDIAGEATINVKEAGEVMPTETEQATPEEATPEETAPETTPDEPPIPPPEQSPSAPGEEPLAPTETPQ